MDYPLILKMELVGEGTQYRPTIAKSGSRSVYLVAGIATTM